MNNLWTIAKYQFLEGFFPYYPKKKAFNLPNNYFLRLLVLLSSYVILGFMVYGFMAGMGMVYLTRENGEVMYFTFFAMMLSLMVIVFYIPKILSGFFSDKSIKIYKTLPIGQGELFIGKLLGEVGSFVDYLLLLIIALIIYFSYKGFNFLVLLLGIINFFPVILIPYSILTILILLIMRFTNAGRHRKLFKNIGYIILFAIMGLIYYFAYSDKSQKLSKMDPDSIKRTMEGFEGISNVFFNSKLFGLSLGGNSKEKLLFTLILLAVAALLLFLAYRLANRFYFDSLSESEGSSDKKKQVKISDENFKSNSQVGAILKRDIKNLFSNIVFLSPAISMSVVFGVLGFTTFRNLIKDMADSNISDPEMRFWIFLIGFLLGLLMWINSGMATASLSREHKSFYLFQTLPIDPKSHFKARFFSSILVMGAFNFLLSIVYSLALYLGVKNGGLFFLGMMLSSITAGFEGLYLGSKNIKTNWNKPEELSKGGLKNFLYYLLSLVFVALLIGCLVFLKNKTGNFIVGAIVDLIIIIVSTGILAKLAIKSYKNGFYDVE